MWLVKTSAGANVDKFRKLMYATNTVEAPA